MALSREQALELAIQRGLVPPDTTLENARERAQALIAQRQQAETSMMPEEDPSFWQNRLNSFKKNFTWENLVQKPVEQTANAPIDLVLGAGDAVRNNMAKILNLASGSNIPLVKSSEGTYYNAGNVAGEFGSFIGAGGLAEGLPVVGNLASGLDKIPHVGSALKRILGAGAYGYATEPENRNSAAGWNAGLATGFEVLPPAARMTGKFLDKFKPEKYAEKILNDLSGGKTLEENAKELASDIRQSFKTQFKAGKKAYGGVFAEHGATPIYETDNALQSAYKTLDKEIPDSYLRKLSKLHQDFEQNPTLTNAHELQSQLGSEIRKLQKIDASGNLSIADRNIKQGYEEAHDAVLADIYGFLSRQGDDSAAKYKTATQNWLENVVPYYENSTIAKMAKGRITNPKNIITTFKNPEPHVEKVLQDLGMDANNKILYAELGKLNSNLNAQNLNKAIADLDKEGLGSYATPKLINEAKILNKRIKNSSFADKAIGATAVTAAAFGLGHSGFDSLVGAVGGLLAYPKIMGGGSSAEAKQIEEFVSKFVQNLYRPATKYVLAKHAPLNLELTKYAGIDSGNDNEN